MSAAEETLQEKNSAFTKRKDASLIERGLIFISSVRFGVTQLIFLVILAFLGMIIVQQNVNGFETYYVSLTPAEKIVFGWLGLFDIYHSWYFNFLLLTLSLNIILASIDHFPTAWKYISKPKLSGTPGWLLKQKQSSVLNFVGENEAEVAEKISRIFAQNGLKPQITESNYNFYAFDESGNKDFSKIENKSYLYVFGESGKWNRLGAYVVHVFLLTLFLGHFVALQTGFDADVRFMPGQITNEIQLIQFNLDKQERFNVALPFTITCTDIQQKLIDPKGEIGIGNTLDWRTQIKITDPEYGETVADISLNKPFNYRGYRFFQASAITMGSARTMTLELTPEKGGEAIKVELARNGATVLPDGTKVEYEAFFPDFTFVNGQPDTRSAEYNNPAAVLNVTPPNGEKTRVFAFANKIADNIPVGAPKAGYKWRMAEFEKSPLAHVLSIKYDPFNSAFVAWYIGGFGLIGALIFVFFFSHKRVWALIERKDESDEGFRFDALRPIEALKGKSDFEIVLGGDTNRSQQGFEDKFNKLIYNLSDLKDKNSESAL
ncbi:MAG: cytochrome c biogenesis protein ResB [Pyrinomonadaceae bacterium]